MSGDPIHEMLSKAAAKGQQIRGGCASCNAYQTLDEDDGVYALTVHHDDDCPIWRAMQAGWN